MTQPPVIIVLNYTTKDLIERCISSVKFSQRPGTYRMIVIDNGSHDNSPAFLSHEAWQIMGATPVRFEQEDVTLTSPTKREYPDKPGEWYSTTIERTVHTTMAWQSESFVVALLDKNYRYETGVNYGITLADKLWPGSDYLLIGSDVQLFRGTIEELQRTMDVHPRIGLVSAMLVGKIGERYFARFGGSREKAGAEHVVGFTDEAWDPNDPDNIHLFKEQSWLTASCLLVRNQVIKDCGLVDMSYWTYCGDADLCKRARQKNWACVYAPTARAMHEDGRTVALVKRETDKAEWDRQQGEEMTIHHCKWMNEVVPFPILPAGALDVCNTWPGR